MTLAVDAPKRNRRIWHSNRDPEILQRVAEYQFLTVGQIAELLSRNITRTRRRLQQLYESGILNRVKVTDSDYPMWVYFLAEKGAKQCADLGFLPEPRWTDSKSPTHVSHDLLISEFHLGLEKALKNHDLKWEQWRGDLRLGPDLIPDARFTIDGEPAYLEVVKSYESEYANGKSSLQRKLEAYRAANVRRVYITMPTQSRVAHFLAKVEDDLNTNRFWFTDEDSFRKRILGKIWWSPMDFRTRTYGIFK